MGTAGLELTAQRRRSDGAGTASGLFAEATSSMSLGVQSLGGLSEPLSLGNISLCALVGVPSPTRSPSVSRAAATSPAANSSRSPTGLVTTVRGFDRSFLRVPSASPSSGGPPSVRSCRSTDSWSIQQLISSGVCQHSPARSPETEFRSNRGNAEPLGSSPLSPPDAVRRHLGRRSPGAFASPSKDESLLSPSKASADPGGNLYDVIRWRRSQCADGYESASSRKELDFTGNSNPEICRLTEVPGQKSVPMLPLPRLATFKDGPSCCRCDSAAPDSTSTTVPSEYCGSSSCGSARGRYDCGDSSNNRGAPDKQAHLGEASMCIRCQCGVQSVQPRTPVADAAPVSEAASPVSAATRPLPAVCLADSASDEEKPRERTRRRKAPLSPGARSTRSTGSASSPSSKVTEAAEDMRVHAAVNAALRERVAMLEELVKQRGSPPKGHRATGAADPVPGLRPREPAEVPPAQSDSEVSCRSEPSRGRDEENLEAVRCATTVPQAAAELPITETETEVSSPVAAAKGKGKGKGKAPPPPVPAPEDKLSPKQLEETSPPGGKGKGKAAPVGPAGKGPSVAVGPAPRKADLKPRFPMKRLFWNSFVLDGSESDSKSRSVWAAIEREGADDLDVEELELLFAEALPGRRDSVEAAAGQYKKLVQKSRLFEETRRRQVCVMLARLPDIETTIHAVAVMDDSRLGKDQVDLLLANAPPVEELAALQAADEMRNANGGLESQFQPWDVAEAFVLRLAQVPDFAIRLQIWSFENSFDERFEVLQAAASEVQEACIALRHSEQAQRMLALALNVGNYLNAGTARGRADGFTVETLTQMRTVKAVPQGPTKTLVDYLVRQLEKTRPGHLDVLFADDGLAASVQKASRHKLAELAQEVQAFCNQAEGFARRAARLGTDEALAMRAHRVSGRQTELLGLQQLFAAADQEYQQLCAWFHENRAARPSDEFFGVWDGFLRAARTALESLYGGGTRRKKGSFVRRRSSLGIERCLTSALED